ncbi:MULTISPECIES: glutamine-hydrolyzing carbamoyl-phosphate synthase small subunit [unclassified Nitratiruptor]|uniref:glutamine-hydrolyzing carbamoyl-phosphate synthase small subunit n=1 Tax=unclassified Nitratiruptor TaxID=2624044 RepID=UPI0019158C7D|nr:MULTISPECIES: glutamine-hydrolyzing carbamoyl-phosphate synthase small subunit [unclassified Nitratiruptor]BCD60922.1 carbamoyl-phosphate synthase small subunit [Nitratiruptor sp. YY08-10]BCD64854.1 carbamoyl-phosphate synthase small subunit [Nitratiruptor sp. YY08-14]
MKKVWIYLENGLFLEGRSFGSEGTKTGEIVFNTSMTGYQEIVTDPSYAGQFVTFTMPEIGNVGVNEEDMESKRAWAKGIIVRSYQKRYSNFRAQKALDELLKAYDVMGICDIDTRTLTKHVRDNGACMMIASTEIDDRDELAKLLAAAPRIEEIDYIKAVSTKEPYQHTQATYDAKVFCYKPAPEPKVKIYVLDFGVKRNILNHLVEAGLETHVLPHTFDPQKIIEEYNEGKVDGVFLSNGPGDPLILEDVHEKIQKLIKAKIPMFGICLGHQLLSIAHGYPTYKLKFGHHGGNHPVRNEKTKRVEITAQNHNYNVPVGIETIAEVTHKNLFDGTIEGIKYQDEPIFSVQHHPEASPGPHDSAYIFEEFMKLILEERKR